MTENNRKALRRNGPSAERVIGYYYLVILFVTFGSACWHAEGSAEAIAVGFIYFVMFLIPASFLMWLNKRKKTLVIKNDV